VGDLFLAFPLLKNGTRLPFFCIPRLFAARFFLVTRGHSPFYNRLIGMIFAQTL
jgi:hypothetical protein